MPQNMSSPLMLSLLDDFHYLQFCQRFFIWNFIYPANLVRPACQCFFSLHFRYIHISKPSNSRTYAFISVRVSGAYGVTLHNKHSIMYFFSCKFIYCVWQLFIKEFYDDDDDDL